MQWRWLAQRVRRGRSGRRELDPQTIYLQHNRARDRNPSRSYSARESVNCMRDRASWREVVEVVHCRLDQRGFLRSSRGRLKERPRGKLSRRQASAQRPREVHNATDTSWALEIFAKNFLLLTYAETVEDHHSYMWTKCTTWGIQLWDIFIESIGSVCPPPQWGNLCISYYAAIRDLDWGKVPGKQ